MNPNIALRKASWSIGSTSSCSNQWDAIRFDSIGSLSSQSIMVSQFNVALFESMLRYSVWFNWHTIIAKHHGQSVQRRLGAVQFNVNPIDLIHRQLNWYHYTYLQNKRMRRCGVAPPPPIIFERLKLPQQTIYRRKGNLSESPNHQKYWENILVSRFYEQFSRNRRNLGHFRKFEKISNS